MSHVFSHMKHLKKENDNVKVKRKLRKEEGACGRGEERKRGIMRIRVQGVTRMCDSIKMKTILYNYTH